MIDIVLAIISSTAMIILNHHYRSECCGRSICDIIDEDNSSQ